MKKLIVLTALVASLVVGASSAAVGYTAANPTYSTNAYNQTHGGPYVTVTKVTGRNLTLSLVNPNNYAACFEYRTDGDTTQATGSPNYNPAIADGLYPFVCLYAAGSQTLTVRVNNYVEVRSVFGAERDWDFNWTRFDSRRA